MSVRIKKVSRLRFSTLQEIGGFTFLDLPSIPMIEQAEDDDSHVVEQSDRIDLLSQRFYGTPDLWWVIARANNLRLLPRDLKLNMTLTIPSRNRVFKDILSLVRR